jgi:hypothetical protein
VAPKQDRVATRASLALPVKAAWAEKRLAALQVAESAAGPAAVVVPESAVVPEPAVAPRAVVPESAVAPRAVVAEPRPVVLLEPRPVVAAVAVASAVAAVAAVRLAAAPLAWPAAEPHALAVKWRGPRAEGSVTSPNSVKPRDRSGIAPTSGDGRFGILRRARWRDANGAFSRRSTARQA